MTSELRLERVELSDMTALALIEALNVELSAMYPEQGANHFDLSPEEVAPGRGAFFVATVSDQPMGCGALRLLDGGEAEVKRMFVAPEARGHGYSRRILGALEDEARALGAVRVVLETGVRQAAALALYEGAGYTRIEAFGEYAGSELSVCMAKAL